MIDTSQLKEHMEIVGSDHEHVGTFDHMDGQRLKLAKQDPASGGEHHYIHIDSVGAVQDGKIVLNRTGSQARDEWGVKQVG